MTRTRRSHLRRRQAACNDNGAARSVGDPHLRTLDHVYYDFMGVGEFMVLESDSGDLAVQFRQAPAGGSRTISIIQAIGVSALGNRITVSRDYAHGIAASVNGVPQDSASRQLLPKGVRVTRRTDDLEIDLPDGSMLDVRSNPAGLDLVASLAEARRPHMHGLLGYTGDAAVQSRDGAKFVREQLRDYQVLYHLLGDSWRLRQPESLFAYGAGQTTATFTDRTFPDRIPQLTAAQRSVAEPLCAALSLGAEEREACVLDVALTGDAGFAVSMASVAGEGRVAGIGGDDRSPVSSDIGPGAEERGFLPAHASRVYRFSVSAGTTAYFAAATPCANAPHPQWAVEADDGLINLASVCNDLGRTVFSKAGDYRIHVWDSGSATGDYHFKWIPSRPDKHLSLTVETEMHGSIERAGAADVYDFTVPAGTVAYFAAAPGCSDTAGLQWTIGSADGTHINLASVCNDLGRVVFAKAGTYQIRVHGTDARTGDYGFTWVASRPDRHLTLAADAEVNGRIERAGAADLYDFTVPAGTVAYFAAAPGCSDTVGLQWSVGFADGTTINLASVCNDLGRIVFAKAGSYQIRIHGSMRGRAPMPSSGSARALTTTARCAPEKRSSAGSSAPAQSTSTSSMFVPRQSPISRPRPAAPALRGCVGRLSSATAQPLFLLP